MTVLRGPTRKSYKTEDGRTEDGRSEVRNASHTLRHMETWFFVISSNI